MPVNQCRRPEARSIQPIPCHLLHVAHPPVIVGHIPSSSPLHSPSTSSCPLLHLFSVDSHTRTEIYFLNNICRFVSWLSSDCNTYFLYRRLFIKWDGASLRSLQMTEVSILQFIVQHKVCVCFASFYMNIWTVETHSQMCVNLLWSSPWCPWLADSAVKKRGEL